VVSLDGSTLDVADTAENDGAFGRTESGRGTSAFPKLRFVALLECGTHVLWGARMDRYATGEVTLAASVVESLRPGMLCLADRLFFGYKLWKKAAETNADLLWRVKRDIYLEMDKRLPDGSYLSETYASSSDRRNRRNGTAVRVLEYRLKGVKGSESLYRLVTTILDHTQAPASELAALYHQRWEIETALDELKTHLRGAQIVLRSKTPVAAEKGAILAGRKGPALWLRNDQSRAWRAWAWKSCLSVGVVFQCFRFLSAIGFACNFQDDRSFDQTVEEGHRQRTIR
jgi:hypothetical protein